MGPPVSNLKSTTAIFLLPEDRLRCRRTRESLGERRSPAGCSAQSVPGVCSPLARKLSMFARWPQLHRPDPCLARGRASREDCRAEGSLPTPWRLARCLVHTHRGPRGLMRSAGLAASICFFSWIRKIPSIATMRCIVFRSDAATSSRGCAPTKLAPAPDLAAASSLIGFESISCVGSVFLVFSGDIKISTLRARLPPADIFVDGQVTSTEHLAVL